MEKAGTGIQRITNACKVNGNNCIFDFTDVFWITIESNKDVGVNVSVNVGVNVGVNSVLDHIKTHQPISAKSLSKYFDKVTQRTIERWIKQLKEDGKIVFKGSPKTGGYYAK